MKLYLSILGGLMALCGTVAIIDGILKKRAQKKLDESFDKSSQDQDF